MKHVTYAEKSLLIGDEAADTLTAYAVVIARNDTADSVTLNAIGTDGDPVEAIFVLTSGTVLMAETSTSTVEEPDNADSVHYMMTQMEEIPSEDLGVMPASPDDFVDMDQPDPS